MRAQTWLQWVRKPEPRPSFTYLAQSWCRLVQHLQSGSGRSSWAWPWIRKPRLGLVSSEWSILASVPIYTNSGKVHQVSMNSLLYAKGLITSTQLITHL